MTTYRLSCAVTVSAYTEVEADSLEDAIEQAETRDVVIGGNGSGTDAGQSWVIEDADGSPQDIHGDSA